MSQTLQQTAERLTKQYQPVLSATVEGVPLPAGLRLRSFSGREELGGVGEFTLVFQTLSESLPAALADLEPAALGAQYMEQFKDKAICFGVAERKIAGMVRGGSWLADQALLMLHVAPALGRLAKVGRKRTFVKKTAPEILSLVLSEVKLEGDTSRLTAARYPKLPLVVQYGETTLGFLRRVAEEAGLTVVADPEEGSVKVLLTDQFPLPGDEVTLVPKPDGVAKDLLGDGWYQGLVESWSDGPEGVSVMLYDPAAERLLSASVPDGVAPAATLDVGMVRGADARPARQLAEARAAGFRAARRVAELTTNCCVRPGMALNLEGSEQAWVVRGVTHNGREGSGYSATVTVHPADVPFVPPRVTPRPLAAGYEPARVVGPDGKPEPGASNAHAEADRSVLIRFRFDAADADPVRVPVAQPLGGTLEFPRIGDEVRVDFQGGDFGQPIISAVLPTAASKMPHDPHARPDAATFTFRSTEGNDLEKATRIHVRTLAGKEKLGLHAAGDLEQKVSKDVRQQVGGGLHQSVAGDAHGKVGGSFLLRAVKDFILRIGGLLGLEVTGEVLIKARKVTIQAEEGIDLISGGSVIRITPSKLLLLSSMVDINPPGGSAPRAGSVAAVPDPERPQPNA